MLPIAAGNQSACLALVRQNTRKLHKNHSMLSLSITSSDSWVQVSLSYPRPPACPVWWGHQMIPTHSYNSLPIRRVPPLSPPPPSFVPKLSQKVKEGLVFWMTFLVMGLGLLHNNYIFRSNTRASWLLTAYRLLHSRIYKTLKMPQSLMEQLKSSHEASS